MKRIWQDLDLFNNYEWNNTDDYKHYQKMVDANQIFKFLADLNVKFDEIRDRVIERDPLPSKVQRKESRRLVMRGKKSSGTDGLAENYVLVCRHLRQIPHWPCKGGELGI